MQGASIWKVARKTNVISFTDCDSRTKLPLTLQLRAVWSFFKKMGHKVTTQTTRGENNPITQ